MHACIPIHTLYPSIYYICAFTPPKFLKLSTKIDPVIVAISDIIVGIFKLTTSGWVLKLQSVFLFILLVQYKGGGEHIKIIG
jgi:hypothetical protein